MGGFRERFTFIQNEKTRGGILFGSPVGREEGEDLLPDRFQASLVCGVH